MDQLAGSGEQPFEAVRTRPFHYRCFNIEALIVSVSDLTRLIVLSWDTRLMRKLGIFLVLISGLHGRNMGQRFKQQ